ncbi:hypothetical protein ACM66B_002263 [Microbotryomycetes sp. NB124-2]
MLIWIALSSLIIYIAVEPTPTRLKMDVKFLETLAEIEAWSAGKNEQSRKTWQGMKNTRESSSTQARPRVGPTPFVSSSRNSAMERFAQGYLAPLDTTLTTFSQPIGPTQSIASLQLPPTRLSAIPSSRLPSNPTGFVKELDYRDDYGDNFMPAELLEEDNVSTTLPLSRSQSEPERFRAIAPEPKRVETVSLPMSDVPRQLKPGDPNPDWLEDALYGPAYVTSKSIGAASAPTELKSGPRAAKFGVTPVKLDYSRIEQELRSKKSPRKKKGGAEQRARRATYEKEATSTREERRKRPMWSL